MEAAVTQEKAERTEGRLAFEWRRLKTGLCWVIFGLGGLGLSMTYFPYLRLTVGDPVARRLKARAMIARSFDFFARTMNRLAVKKRFGVSLSGETEEVRAHFRSVASLAAFIRENRTEEK